MSPYCNEEIMRNALLKFDELIPKGMVYAECNQGSIDVFETWLKNKLIYCTNLRIRLIEDESIEKIATARENALVERLEEINGLSKKLDEVKIHLKYIKDS